MNELTSTATVMTEFPAHISELSARFDDALEASGFDSVVILAGDEVNHDRDDTAYPFTPDPYFKAWVPLTRDPGSAVHYVPGERPRLLHFHDTSFWHEPASQPAADWVEQFELIGISTPEQRTAELGAITGRVAAIGPHGSIWPDGAAANDTTLLNSLDFARAKKTAYEVACICRANEIASLGHATAQCRYHEDASEFDINLAYCKTTLQRETELPYANIVAFNEHAAVLHYQNLRHEPPRSPSSFLLDAGASCNGYAADITRTISRETQAMAELIAAVDAMQRRLCDEIRPGLDFVALNDRAHELVAEILETLHLVECTAADAHARGITCAFLPHGLGHLLGLQVHDVGGRLISADGATREPPAEHPMLRLTRVLEPGFVVTIEPGIYFIPSLLDALRHGDMRDAVDWRTVDALARFGGVRIEDDVLVSDTGCVNLSRPALRRAGIW